MWFQRVLRSMNARLFGLGLKLQGAFKGQNLLDASGKEKRKGKGKGKGKVEEVDRKWEGR